MTPTATPTLKLRLKPGNIIPHVIQLPIEGKNVTVTFAPTSDIEIPKHRAEAYLASYPDKYQLEDGSAVNLEAYTILTSFKKEKLVQAIDRLTDEEMLVVYDDIQAIIANRGKKADSGGAENELLTGLTKAQLLELAGKAGVEVTPSATKAELVKILSEYDLSAYLQPSGGA